MISKNLKLPITQRQLDSMDDFILGCIKKIPCEIPTLKISEYAQSKRILPAGTPRPGPLDLSYTPYLIEPMDNMAPSSSIQKTAILKAAQLGFTMMGECIICYYIGYSPADQLLVSATDDLLERWSSRRLEPAIDSFGFRGIIKATDSGNSSRKKIGDKTFSKEYYGMRLDMASAQSAASLRSSDKRVLIRDEIDGAPKELRSGEGNWLAVSEARTNSWGNRKKILDISTPTEEYNSQIYVAYNRGDKRHFFVPCKHCGEFITLDFKQLVPEYKDGILYDVVYGCQKCGAILYNYDKTDMLPNGKWIPTGKCSSEIRSYYINSLYSPVGMMSWKALYQKYLEAVEESDMKPFYNLYLGLPYREEGSRPHVENVVALKDNYKMGEVPQGVLFLTFGADVQRGMSKYSRMSHEVLDNLIDKTLESELHKQNFPRIEIEILAHGHGWRNYSVVYKSFYGHIDDPYAGAWERLNEFAETCHGCDKKCNYKSPECKNFIGGLTYKNEQGMVYNTQLCLIDSGDGTFSDVVYRFCERWSNTFPIKGMHDIKKSNRKMESNIDEIISGNRDRYRSTRASGNEHLYLINTNHYKNIIYRNLKIPKTDIGDSKPGTMSFPKDYPERYFKMLVAEEKREDGTFYCPNHTRNEALDIKVYNLAAGDIYLDTIKFECQDYVRKNGGTREDISMIDTRYAIEKLRKDLNI